MTVDEAIDKFPTAGTPMQSWDLAKAALGRDPDLGEERCRARAAFIGQDPAWKP
ncbi:hypothetical protein O1R50_05635 [Glycomyces luteolus]|uniref:Uncharacterized protein n=1 Tax=Glycomyces luteolus TaxID=2670330 RepID=A0A9X3P6L6_9ACTN|nr:hypothetical protein [Glycomyces luteolus]MDA1359094.1 hypothetical protein [Glycomyces luteolus]